ncbi:MAG TPA: hypothetical protein EYP56_04980, partial [Planctomycetaceae bacterium]|nr:hypothetical protein [Planctomycetaceae bacterium]
MPAKSKKRRKKRRAEVDLAVQAERALAKGQYKQGYKEAKVCFRNDPTEANRELFQRACFGRASELLRMGYRDEARGVAEVLFDLGPPFAEQIRGDSLVELAVGLGLADRLPDAGDCTTTAGVTEGLLPSVADQCVLHPEHTPRSWPQIGQEALRVRAALEAIEAGDEARAMEELRGISRSSPLAEWKFFVRGLAAYYRQDSKQMNANWSRLDPQRAAARIAAPLQALDRGEVSLGEDRRLEKLETAILGRPICSVLIQLRSHLARRRWRQFLGRLKRREEILRGFDPQLPQRLVNIACEALVRDGDLDELAEFTRAVDPPPCDPQWNRTWARALERAEKDEVEEIADWWEDYAKDLARCPELSHEERRIAQALVWDHVAQLYFHECLDALEMRWEGRAKQWCKRSAKCLDKSIRLAPEILSTYVNLAKLHLAVGDEDKAAKAYQRLLEQEPNDLAALKFLAEHYRRRDDPTAAQPYIERACRLKPTSQEFARLRWWLYLALARQHALARQWEESRAAFEEADRADPSRRASLRVLAPRAVMEMKARNLDVSDVLMHQVRGSYDEPTPALLALCVESVRYGLTQGARKGFQRELQMALKRRVNSQTAGRLSQLMREYLEESPYPGRPRHTELVLSYLERSGRVKWQEEDLRDVCMLLDKLASDGQHRKKDVRGLLAKLAAKGIKRFAHCPLFYVLTGECEMRKEAGSRSLGYARYCFLRAVHLWKANPDPPLEPYVERARHMSVYLEERGVPPASRPKPPMPG